MKESVAKAIKKHVSISEKEILSLLEIPPSAELGDFSFPCFALSRTLKKSPNEIALELSKNITSQEFEKVEAKGPYVNFFLNGKNLAKKTISEILKKKEKYGRSKFSNRKTIIEFSQANTHKAFHIGHVRGTSLGESLSRIFEFVGNKPIRANYQGDSGMHVAKWLWCYKKFHGSEKPKKDENWFASIYTEAVKKLTENPLYQTEVDEINRALSSSSNKNLIDLWKKTRKLSLDSLEVIYKELNTHFDKYFFESEMEETGKEISKALLRKGIAEISEGATIVRLDKYNLGVWVLLRKDGTVLYSAKDLALAKKKFEDLKIERSIYIVGAEQRTHFYQLFKTLELFGFKQASQCQYLPVTEVRLPTGKMSSRTGDNILYSNFREELKDYAKSEIRKRDSKISSKDIESRALAIAIASLKYSMLKQDVNKNIIFSKEDALSFEGNTGPYLLYTYARSKSILRKAKLKKDDFKIHSINEKEKSLVVELSKFPEIVKSAYQELAPNLIANYAYQLSQKFNEFYHSSPVIGSNEENFRIALVSSFSTVLKTSLNLLGIETLERM